MKHFTYDHAKKIIPPLLWYFLKKNKCLLRYIYNVEKNLNHTFRNTEEYIDYDTNIRNICFDGAIEGSFILINTEEGFDYWRNLSIKWSRFLSEMTIHPVELSEKDKVLKFTHQRCFQDAFKYTGLKNIDRLYSFNICQKHMWFQSFPAHCMFSFSKKREEWLKIISTSILTKGSPFNKYFELYDENGYKISN